MATLKYFLLAYLNSCFKIVVALHNGCCCILVPGTYRAINHSLCCQDDDEALEEEDTKGDKPSTTGSLGKYSSGHVLCDRVYTSRSFYAVCVYVCLL